MTPRIVDGSVKCGPVDGTGSTYLSGDVQSAWQWEARLHDVPDGVLELSLDHAANADGSDNTHARDRLLVRKGTTKNVMVFPNNDYDDDQFGFEDGHYIFTHHAKGADLFRYSWNFGKNYTKWGPWEDITKIPTSVFEGPDLFWEGQHIIVQCA